MDKVINWGLMGAGRILKKWVAGAKQVEGMEIVSVASRSKSRAEEAAKEFRIPNVQTYEELAKNPDISVVYIPVPHTAHKRLAILAMEHGKHVLVEKPMAVTAQEATEMVICARKNNVFLMEAVMTRFFPLYRTLDGLVSQGTIGKIRAVSAGMGSRLPDDRYNDRHFNPDLAGGAWLDMGVYSMHFAHMFLKKFPIRLTGFASMGTDEFQHQVDEQSMVIGQYDQGELASMSTAIRTKLDGTGYVYGTHGMIVIPDCWWPNSAQIRIAETGETINIKEKLPVNNFSPDYHDIGYQYEIQHVNECIRKGETESSILPLDVSIEILRECDQIRSMWGLKYPFEK